MRLQGRIGVLGGTFDPIHCGHLDAADAARRACDLDTVLLVPARTPPHRRSAPLASAYHRFAMAALASDGNDELAASDIELAFDGPSFTSVTLARLAQEGLSPGQLFFIIGTDAFADIASWYDYPAVLDRSHFVAVSRPGCPLAALRERLTALRERMREPAGRAATAGQQPAIWLVEASTRTVSSSLLRRRLTGGQSIDGLVPDAVARHIAKHALYARVSAAGSLHE